MPSILTDVASPRAGKQTVKTHKSLTGPLWRTLAVVGVDSVHAGSSVGTLVAGAVIDVALAVSPVETWRQRIGGRRALKHPHCRVIFSSVHSYYDLYKHRLYACLWLLAKCCRLTVQCVQRNTANRIRLFAPQTTECNNTEAER